MSKRVLVADDSSTMRKIIIRSLQAVGVPEATEAADGNEAVALFKPGAFDLVLTDWNMPGKSGLEVVQAIRAQDANVPIIMVTTEARAIAPSWVICDDRAIVAAVLARESRAARQLYTG